ncbi:MAG: glycosyltransferase [Thermomicrobiales bacterium]
MNDAEQSAERSSRPPSLSLVIPAYNESSHLHATLMAAWSYLVSEPYDFELIVVDDGSDDTTRPIAESFAAAYDPVSVISIPHGGKAAALRAGMSVANGDLIAFTDADLATPLHYFNTFRAAVKSGAGVVIGSREGAGARRIGEPYYRHVMGRAFNVLVRQLVLPGIQDTQCGFKLFTRSALDAVLDGTRLYATAGATVTGARVTAFDVELLVVARRRGFAVQSIPVVWTYGKQSKVNPARDTWHNLRDVIRIKFNDLRGYYDPNST